MQGPTYTINMDASQGLGVLGLLQNRINSLGNTITSDLTNKLKGAIALGTIEEATRRSGEWALNMEKTAQALGTTSEKLQSLNLLASMSNVEEGKVTSFFENLDDKRKEAIKGNQDLVLSFSALGLTITDLLHSSKADLFGKLLSSGKLNGVVAGSPMGNAVENIFGNGSIPSLQALSTTANGKNLNDIAASATEGGEIVSNEDTAAMADMWKEIKMDFQQSLVKLAPIGKLLLGFVTMLSELVLGVSTVVSHIYNFFKHFLSGDMGGMLGDMKGLFSGVLANAGFGVIKIITGLLDMASDTLAGILKTFHLLPKDYQPHSYTDDVQGLQDKYNTKFGINRTDIRGGEGIGNGVAFAGTGGAGAVARGAEGTLMDVAGVAEKAGATKTAGQVLDIATKAAKVGEYKGLFKGAGANLAAQAAVLSGGTASSIHGANGGLGSTDAPFNGVMLNQAPSVMHGESASMLKLGGVFGTGVQSRIIRLNEQMVTILAQIQRNTSYNNYGNTPTNTGGNPNTSYSGGF